MSMRLHAVSYAKRGWPVHPVWPGRKTPLLEHWPERATTDPAIIRRWWSRWPAANIGLRTGGEPRLLVIDIDPGGEDSLAALEREHGRLPTTLQVRTPRGGRHFYLRVPPARPLPGNSAGRLGPNIDTRGEGGYVLAPPSVVNGGRYSPITREGRALKAPAWLLDLLEMPDAGRAASPEEWLAFVTEGVDQGARNQSLTRLAGKLFRHLPPADALLAAQLVLAFNEARCRPPLPVAEVCQVLNSIAAREARRRGF
jgi:hypothetical protein